MIRFKYGDGEKEIDYATLSFQRQGMVTALKYKISKSLESIQCPICKDRFDITIALSTGEDGFGWKAFSPCHSEFDKLVKQQITL